MKNIYILNVYREETNELSEAWSELVFSTMKAACRYGERIHRKFGHTYRVKKTMLMDDNKYIW